MSPAPVLFVVAGPNGAGKSTFVEHVLWRAAPHFEFVNADEIERLANLAGEAIDSYAASQRAAARRDELIAARRSFITETVFSHPSKVDLVAAAVSAGYIVQLHVILAPLPVAAALAEAIGVATESTVWDSSAFSAFAKVATFLNGRLIGEVTWPTWTPAPLRKLR